MPPLKPHWAQPSHPDIQEVVVTGDAAEFTTKSISKIALPPFGLFAKLEFPPCTEAPEPTYATVQMGRDRHLDLNSDLLYINHSCEPSLFFDMASMNVIAGPKGLQPGDELTFFYPSTEWYMAQPFDCLCGAPTCRGRIAGARDMTLAQLDGLWLNGHIRELLEERERGRAATANADHAQTTNGVHPPTTNGTKPASNDSENGNDETILALRAALSHAENAAATARQALASYLEAQQKQPAGVRGAAPNGTSNTSNGDSNGNGKPADGFGAASDAAVHAPAGAQRRGPTSRELSGEEGGDTTLGA